MLEIPFHLTVPGLFVTGTDTDVGKTVVSCAIAAAWRFQNPRSQLGVCKPLASDCSKQREGLVNRDAEALAHFSDCRQPLDVINPIRFAPALAPAVAAQQTGQSIDWDALWRSLSVLDESSDALLIEGVGGLMVPLDPDHPQLTVLHLIKALGYPVLVVARSVLGTLNHTAMTVALLKSAQCPVAGIVMNSYDADPSLSDDPSVASNRQWLEKLTGVPVLATVPRVDPKRAQPDTGELDGDLLAAVAMVDWRRVMR